MIKITKANILDDLTVELFFSDDSVRVVNIGDFIRRHPHPQYNKYLDQKKFKNFSLVNGNIVWGKNWDLIFPLEELYSGRIE